MSYDTLRIIVATQSPGERLAGDETPIICFLGELITISFVLTVGTIACALPRSPAGTAATFTGGAITPDVIGWHRFTAANGSANPARSIQAVVFPVAAKTDLRIKEPNRQVLPGATLADPSPRGELEIRRALRSFVLNEYKLGRDLAAFDTLTANAPLPASIDWNKWVGAAA